MRRGAKKQEDIDETPGGDSFLDIVANIVGILVLLVVVVGVRAGRQIIMPEPVAVQDTAAIEEKTLRIRKKLQVEKQEIVKMARQASLSSQEARLRDQARQDLALYIEKLKQEIAQERSQLSESDRRSYEIGNKLAQARLQLEELTREQITLSSNPLSEEAEPLYYDPTPIIRERVTDEIRLQLKDGELAYLPIDELRSELTRDFPNLRKTISSEKGAEVILEHRVGPIDGFTLRTLFGTKRLTTSQGVVPNTDLILVRLEETGSLRTESLATLANQNSHINAKLSNIDPSETVVTLIVYPNSYESLPEYEQLLRERGYRVAKALIQEGKPIEFSPSGRATQLQ